LSQPSIPNLNKDEITAQTTIRRAWPDDEPAITTFVDRLLSVNDYFVPRGRQKAFLKKYQVFIAELFGQVVGWSVVDKHGKLIHLLVETQYRGCGIGERLLQISAPKSIRSKSDQSTGNPVEFYKKHGYTLIAGKVGKNRNIDILIKGDSIHFD